MTAAMGQSCRGTPVGIFLFSRVGMKVVKNKVQKFLGKCIRKSTINVLLREPELGLSLTLNLKETSLFNGSSFMVSGIRDQLGHDQNENGSYLIYLEI